jgi:hypothetical protein
LLSLSYLLFLLLSLAAVVVFVLFFV